MDPGFTLLSGGLLYLKWIKFMAMIATVIHSNPIACGMHIQVIQIFRIIGVYSTTFGCPNTLEPFVGVW